MRGEILIISDTHLQDASGLPRRLLELAALADHIIHAGDHSVLEVVRVLEACAPVTAVHGNVEQADVQAVLPKQAVAAVLGVRIGVVHDAGERNGRHDRLQGWFPGCGLVAYGHSHEPEIAWVPDGPVIINPGSPTQRRRAPTHTVVWARVRDGSVAEADLVHLPEDE